MRYAKAIKEAQRTNQLNIFYLKRIGLDINKHWTRRIKKLNKKHKDEIELKTPRGECKNWYN